MALQGDPLPVQVVNLTQATNESDEAASSKAHHVRIDQHVQRGVAAHGRGCPERVLGAELAQEGIPIDVVVLPGRLELGQGRGVSIACTSKAMAL